MPFVLDASITMAWCFEEEITPYARAVLDRLDIDAAMVPAIWPLEVANAMLVAERRQQLLPARAERFKELVTEMPITVIPGSFVDATSIVMNAARAFRLTCYDAAYLELAMREGIPIATRDKQLVEAARSAGVSLVE
jgi:predicted nucleic acid-binding protein